MPGANDDAVISTETSQGFVRRETTANVRSVARFETLLVDGPAGGSLAISQASSTLNMVQIGDLTGAGDMTVTDFLNWGGGSMRGTGKFILPALSTATITGSDPLSLARTLNNSGSAKLNATSFSMSVG